MSESNLDQGLEPAGATEAAEPRLEQQNAWAPPTHSMTVDGAPKEAMNINVEGRHLVSPLQGFGQMWQKTFQIRLTGVQKTPAEVMAVWRGNFQKFQPPENKFYPTMSGIQPGKAILIEGKVPPLPGMPSIMPVATGVMVLYVDDVSFTVMNPEGHPLSGWNTFSVFEDDDGVLVAQVLEQSRPSDPLYELFFRFLGSSAQQDNIWLHVLASLAQFYGVTSEKVTLEKVLMDPSVQWSEAKNLTKSAAIRTVFYMMGAPIRWMARKS
jgi:hypothetical protein